MSDIIRKKKTPSFQRTDSHKIKRVGTKWRKPKGIQNKRRLQRKGYSAVVKVGYGTNNKTKGTREGLKIVLIKTVAQIDLIDKKTQGVIISAKLGLKNRLLILEKALSLGIKVFNFNVDKKISQIKNSLEQQKKQREERAKKKEKKEKQKEKEKQDKKDKDKKESEEKSKQKQKDEEKSFEEDKKDQDKKELDKLLTKKQ